jgi:microcystin-dependent protein
MYVNSTPPTGWLKCDGSSVNNESYPALYAVIGTTFGGNVPNFNLPNLVDRIPLGSNINGSGGSLNHTHTVNHQHNFNHNHIVSHFHNVDSHSHSVDESDHTHMSPNHNHTYNNHNHTVAHNHAAHTGGPNGLSLGGAMGMTFVGRSDHGHSSITSGWPNISYSANNAGTMTNNTAATGGANTNVTNTNSSAISWGQEPILCSSNNTNTNNAPQQSATDDGMPPYLVVHFIIKY